MITIILGSFSREGEGVQPPVSSMESSTTTTTGGANQGLLVIKVKDIIIAIKITIKMAPKSLFFLELDMIIMAPKSLIIQELDIKALHMEFITTL